MNTGKKIGLISVIVLVIAFGIGSYLYFKPHRDVQASEAFAKLSVQDLVSEFTVDAKKANSKYLLSDGNSRILIITGRVHLISANQLGETVIILKDSLDKVGVIATFTKEASKHVEKYKMNDLINVKGAITAGNSYDADLDLFEHAVLIQCDIID